ncbi:hypothetical protein GCM10028809_32680 [Spirosoma gilvum]
MDVSYMADGMMNEPETRLPKLTSKASTEHIGRLWPLQTIGTVNNRPVNRRAKHPTRTRKYLSGYK